jgi:hypothetical protein
MNLITCDDCGGFSPSSRTSCPHCDGPLRRIAHKLARLAAGGALLLTMMACYGGPPKDCPAGTDQDGDGWCTEKVRGHGVDCDDGDAKVTACEK